MKNTVTLIGVALILIGVAIVAISTGTQTGLEISVFCVALATLRVMKYEDMKIETESA